MAKVVVLGCGPAGLFAAHAAVQAGHSVVIFSKPRKSFMRGAQYLHRPIPGLSGDPFEVEYDLLGSVEGYRQKVYGDMGDILVSPETLVGKAPAWDIREAYDAAWELYKGLIVSWDASNTRSMPLDVIKADYVFSTIPAPLLCRAKTKHKFRSADIWATDMVKPSGQFLYDDGGPVDNLVICSGDPDDWWYRASRIHGWENTEYPIDREPPDSEHHSKFRVTKPIDTDCDCLSGITRLGRYGRWTKGELSHEAYYNVESILKAADYHAGSGVRA